MALVHVWYSVESPGWQHVVVLGNNDTVRLQHLFPNSFGLDHLEFVKPFVCFASAPVAASELPILPRSPTTKDKSVPEGITFAAELKTSSATQMFNAAVQVSGKLSRNGDLENMTGSLFTSIDNLQLKGKLLVKPGIMHFTGDTTFHSPCTSSARMHTHESMHTRARAHARKHTPRETRLFCCKCTRAREHSQTCLEYSANAWLQTLDIACRWPCALQSGH